MQIDEIRDDNRNEHKWFDTISLYIEVRKIKKIKTKIKRNFIQYQTGVRPGEGSIC